MRLNQSRRLILSSSLSVFLSGCGAPNYAPSTIHMTVEKVESEAPANTEDIPALVKVTTTVPTMSGEKESDTFDVVATNLPVRDLLFALARDAEINMDIDAKVGGLITMSALDQTLDAIIARIAEQIPIRVVRIGDALVIKNDEPYYKRYHLDYLSASRTYSSSASSGGVGGGIASVSNTASNDFWLSFETSIAAILGITIASGTGESSVAGIQGERKDVLEQSLGDAAQYSTKNTYDFNTNTGILMVYAPERLQKQVQQYIDESLDIAKRQVLLEATVVEVILNNQYSQGIDWSIFNQYAAEGLVLYSGGNIGGAAAALREIIEEFTISETKYFPIGEPGELQEFADLGEFEKNAGKDLKITNFSSSVEEVRDISDEVVGYNVNRQYTAQRVNKEATDLRAGGLVPLTPSVPGAAFTGAFRVGDISAAVQLLDAFGDAKVLSSPRLSVLNNQPGLLRVVDQEVYFNIEINEDVDAESGQVISRTYEVTENTVDVGFSLNVLPHITNSGEVFLNLKPSVTRILDYRRAPTPAAVGGNSGAVDNLVPITRVRELESVMTLRDGEIAVLGGLLEDRTSDNNSSVPGLADLPGIGFLFQKKNESTYKTEFVVFIKAKIIKNPSLYGDYADYRKLLPDAGFIIRDRSDMAVPRKQRDSR